MQLFKIVCGVCNDNFKNIFISIFRRPHMGSRPQGWKTTIVLKSKSTSLLCVHWSFDAGFFYIRSECLNSLLVILSIKYLLFSIRVEWTVRRTSCFRSWCTGMKLPFLLASPFCVTGPKMESQRTKVRISFMFFLSCRFFPLPLRWFPSSSCVECVFCGFTLSGESCLQTQKLISLCVCLGALLFSWVFFYVCQGQHIPVH